MLALCAANATYLVGLEATLGRNKACLVAGNGGELTQMLRRHEYSALCIDEMPDLLRLLEGSAMSSGVVLGAEPVIDLLDELNCDAVLPFKSGARVWSMAEFQNLKVLAAPHKLTRRLENKLTLAELAQAADARVPDTVTIKLDEALAVAARAGGIALPRVYQPAVSFAGAGTVLLRTGEELAQLVEATDQRHSIGKLVEYVDGDPVTVNGVVIPPHTHGAGDAGAVLVGMVARQLTGIEGLTPTEFGSCGNDWTNPPERSEIISVRSLAHRIGEVLAQREFVGAFGIDVVIPKDGGAPVLIEINPRWTASLALQVELQQQSGLPTLLDAHLAAFSYRPVERASLEELESVYGDSAEAAIIRQQSEHSTLLAYNATGAPLRVNPQVKPGVWSFEADSGDLTRVRDGWCASDLSGQQNEFILLPQGTERPVVPGGYLARIIKRGPSAADAAARTLTDDTRRLADRVITEVTATPH